ncbi:MAG: hypothetical protein ACYC2E_13095 [Sulfuricella sp.]
MGKKIAWTDGEMEYMEDHYPHNPAEIVAQELTAIFGTVRTSWAVYRCACNAGIKKQNKPASAMPTKARLQDAEDIIYRLVDRLLNVPLDAGGIGLVRDAQRFIGWNGQ